MGIRSRLPLPSEGLERLSCRRFEISRIKCIIVSCEHEAPAVKVSSVIPVS
jgi:hypothetical protein